MTTETKDEDARLHRLNANIAKVEDLSKRLTAALTLRKNADPALQGPSQEVYMKAAAAYVAEMMQNPSKIIEQQIGYWGKTLKHYVEAQQALAKGELKAPENPGPKDRRFANPLWDSHPLFNFLKQQYLFNAEAITGDDGGATAVVASLPAFKQSAKAMRDQLGVAASVALASAQ